MTTINSTRLQQNKFGIIKSVQIDIYSPGGNNTCLVQGIIDDSLIKNNINDIIMKLYANVEQVGFIGIDGEIPRLEMAGGEFCGNALRSFAYKFFDGKQGEGAFKISGVNRLLKAGINLHEEVWAEMPIYQDINRIKSYNDGNFLVEMEGICHYICYMNTERPISCESDYQEKIKEASLRKIVELGLDKYLAVGIMYVYKNGDSFFLEPVVYVSSINTLFYETACGSGTTALGMVESIKKRTSISNLPVTQPSGELIKISVSYDTETNSFGNAIILGKVKNLVTGNTILLNYQK